MMKKLLALGLCALLLLAGCAKQPTGDGTISETPITVGKGTDYPLKGLITTGKTPSKTAVVLVQGSGSSDKNETVFENTPFLDLAHGLALQGIDSIRYDKRTFVHGRKIAALSPGEFTIVQETIEDAILAAKLLQEQGYEHIYLLGHSLGGMMALRIDQESGGLFDGLILLAGSPRYLTDIIIDQNAAVISAMTDPAEQQKGQAIVDAEVEKLNNLATLSQEELNNAVVFGMPGPYLLDLNRVDTAELARASTKPILVLQGSADFQVYADKDFPLWKECLKDNPKAQFRLYDGLNHLFMESKGDKQGTVEEYKTKGTLAQPVIDDIAKFINQ